MASRQITVTVDEEVLAKLDEFADDLGLNRSVSVNMLLKASLTQDMGGMFREMFAAAMKRQAEKKKQGDVATA